MEEQPVKEMLLNQLFAMNNLAQRTVNGTLSETGVNAVPHVVVEINTGKERKSKKQNSADRIAPEGLEK